eukprot:TRINITY_DN1850_c0_g1_i2.p1 TRINITY_DN1850_c0_g1~~TRINITY_DN1850_c0_g1_i2.p1  ORF type:complete len:152 (+),score=19.99 TRINITY_DN1850_c0_g1_i2:60-515(+)
MNSTTSLESNDALLDMTLDMYSGVVINSEKLPNDSTIFAEKLESSLKAWKEAKYRAVWLCIPIKQASLVPVAVREGFEYHHAKKDYLTLTKWLPEDCKSKIPAYASSYLGVGGIVINDNNEILVIAEKYADRFRWKIPGLVQSFIFLFLLT